MLKLTMTLCSAALLAAAGCAPDNPSSAGDEMTGQSAQKLTVSGTTAGGHRGSGNDVGAGRDTCTCPEDTAGQGPGGPVHTLVLDDTLRVGSLRVAWVDVQDSRCPEGAQCIWAGEVKVMLDVTPVSGTTHRVELVLGDGGPQTAEARDQGYLYQLLEVTPYPRLSTPTGRDDYEAAVSIERSASGLKASAEPAGGTTEARLGGP